MGVYAMRKHITNYLKGLPDFQSYRQRLVSGKDPAEIFAALDDVLVAYDGFEFENTPIQLVNYHENCAL